MIPPLPRTPPWNHQPSAGYHLSTSRIRGSERDAQTTVDAEHLPGDVAVLLAGPIKAPVHMKLPVDHGYIGRRYLSPVRVGVWSSGTQVSVRSFKVIAL